ncbi:RdgB/HAM1 family non-canonical purine NTP pyrophosphatase [Ponticaulis sp.]|uniref:RdgB/HAM1 family non-canonical purine NTP pyrophosphatase n=1 Tax=Ponticaulis sp. TaxID=2020902 RepID=UPI000B6970FD|nr:RdgB/HAM1 family non-canonical purine NTP pyrophosphatase [Ponticaulis sp.]MAI91091.1 non-canonical purine NTP pyrophosphatase, RdgB/HAM1 family [Ponticaulis sp.]OUX98416.1 MAG: non-canonical purine NTP pyrophosphatase, RdgB/HAM1 family [Hyphomonadaceae bacterium TMED5]
MTRTLSPGPLIAATHNKGKVKELKALFEPLGFTVTSAIELDLEEPEETEKTFAGNAALKALAAARTTGKPALSDDSGLEVFALNGQPGIYSARWAGEPRSFENAMKRVEDELKTKNTDDYSARFVCALAIGWPDGHTEIFEGEVRGHLEFPARGDQGFVYDPIFVADGETITFGEMDPDKKHAMSHRADAFVKLKTMLEGI